MRKEILSVLIAFLLTPHLQAQAQNSVCHELVRQGIMDTISTKFKFSSYSETSRRICENTKIDENSQKDAGLEYLKFQGSYSESEAKSIRRAMCESNYALNDVRSDNSSVTRYLSSNAVNAIKACTNTSGLILDVAWPNGQEGDVVSMEVRYLPPPGAGKSPETRRFDGPPQIVGDVQCKGQLMQVDKGTELRDAYVQMICERKNIRQPTGGATLVHEGGTVAIPTTAGTLIIPIAKKIAAPDCRPTRVASRDIPSSFERVGRGVLTYGALITDTLAASKHPNQAVPRNADFSLPVDNCGLYAIWSVYASAESRPATLELDGRVVSSSAIADNTGSWTVTKRSFEGVAFLEKGDHTLRVQRIGPIPHIDRFELSPM